MSDELAGFNWDEGNRKKCRKHGVTLEEIETALGGPIRVFPDPAHPAAETRYLGIGETAAGRQVLIAFVSGRRGEAIYPPHQCPVHARQGDKAL